MKLPVYLGLLVRAEQTLAQSFRQVADGHGDEPDVAALCRTLAEQCDAHVAALQPVLRRYGPAEPDDEPERLHADALGSTRQGPVGLLRDLQDMYLLATLVDITWTLLTQAGQTLRDTDLLDVVRRCDQETAVQAQWLRTRMKQAAPQAPIAAS